MSAMADFEPSSDLAAVAARAARLDRALQEASPVEIIRAAISEVGRDKLALVSSFGTESAVLLKFAADVDPAIPVVFLDTGWLFEETLAYRDTLTRLLGLRDVRSIKPDEAALKRADADRELWLTDPDACCRIRKVEPLARALSSFDGWLNGRKRFQGGDRANIPVVEAEGLKLKFNPLANVSAEELEGITTSESGDGGCRSRGLWTCRWTRCPARLRQAASAVELESRRGPDGQRQSVVDGGGTRHVRTPRATGRRDPDRSGGRHAGVR